jgi:hypothetical protein
MEFVHRCHFCGWQRQAQSPTILSPQCDRCGSLLDSSKLNEPGPPPAIETRLMPGIRLSSRTARALRLSTFATVLFTAAATGFHAGGGWAGLGAFAAAGLATTPALVRD